MLGVVICERRGGRPPLPVGSFPCLGLNDALRARPISFRRLRERGVQAVEVEDQVAEVAAQQISAFIADLAAVVVCCGPFLETSGLCLSGVVGLSEELVEVQLLWRWSCVGCGLCLCLLWSRCGAGGDWACEAAWWWSVCSSWR